MCRLTKVKDLPGTEDGAPGPSPPHKGGDASRKQQHLITDAGFFSSLVVNLVAMSTVLAGCTYIPPIHNVSIDIYYAINNSMMEMANRLAWWSLLGLLSSSCCALQILLNAASFGCAGFNTVLGPLRPTFVALTIMTQISSWYVGYLRPYQWRAIAASTVLSIFFTTLPELLAWRTSRRENTRRQLTDWGDLDDLQFDKGILLQFRLGTMGCTSCVSTVSRVLDGMNGVISHCISLDDGVAEVTLEAPPNNQENNQHTLWKDIATKLEEAGFPAEPVDHDRSKKDR